MSDGEVRYNIARTILNDEQKKLYATNVWFRHGIDELLNKWLVLFVAGLELQAKEKEAETQKQIAEVRALSLTELGRPPQTESLP